MNSWRHRVLPGLLVAIVAAAALAATGLVRAQESRSDTLLTTEHYLKMAVDLARQNAERGGRPFASIIVKHDKVVATAVNTVAATGDPCSSSAFPAKRWACSARCTS